MVLPAEQVRRSYREQAQLAQAHRWLAAACAGDPAGIFDVLLAPDATLGGLAAAGVPMVSEQLPDLRGARVSNATGPIFPDAQSVTLIVAAIPAGTAAGATIDGHLTFHFTGPDLLRPLIQSVALSDVAARNSRPAGPEQVTASRVLSLKHRWHALVEDPDRTAEPFRELIADGFVMDWGEGSVRSFDELSAWVTGSAASVSAARHDLAEFEWSADGPERYRARFLLHWSGLSRSGRPMAARSEHRWQIQARPRQRFPAIARMDVNLLVSFHMVEEPSNNE